MYLYSMREQSPGGRLGIPKDRDQQSWIVLNDPKNALPLKESPKSTIQKLKS